MDDFTPVIPGCIRGPRSWCRKNHSSFDEASRTAVKTVYLVGAHLRRQQWEISEDAKTAEPPCNALEAQSKVTDVNSTGWSLPEWMLRPSPAGAIRRAIQKATMPRKKAQDSVAASVNARRLRRLAAGVAGLPALPWEMWELILMLLPLRPDEYRAKTFGLLGQAWTANPPASACQLWIDPCSVALLSGGRILVVDSGNNRLTMLIASEDHPRMLSLAGDTEHGHNDGTPGSARFAFPRGAAFARDGSTWVTDRNCVRRLAPETLEVTTEGPRNANQRHGATAPFKLPQCVTIDHKNQVYVADTYNNQIRRLAPDGSAPIVAGTGEKGYRDGLAHTASLARPRAMAVDGDGNILIADSNNHCIRRLEILTGLVSTIAGTGEEGDIDGPATTATFSEPSGLAVDAEGNILVADRGNGLVRLIATNGEVSTISGNRNRSSLSDPSEAARRGCYDSKGLQTTFSRPTGIAIDEFGAIIVTDSLTDRVRKLELVPHGFSASYPAPRCFRVVRAPHESR